MKFLAATVGLLGLTAAMGVDAAVHRRATDTATGTETAAPTETAAATEAAPSESAPASEAVVESVKLNVHVKLVPGNECTDIANQLNADASKLMEENDNVTNLVNFADGNDPHITLYMTDFNKADEEKVIKFVEDFKYGPCEVVLDPVVDTGTGYLFWDPAESDLWNGTKSNECLRKLADEFVNGLKDFIVAPTEEKLPGWIKDLKDPEEQKGKTEAYLASGSPNVFGQFNPHVTIAARPSGTTVDFETIAAALGNKNCSFTVENISLGQTGPGGTVLTGKDLATAKPQAEGETGSETATATGSETPMGSETMAASEAPSESA